ncbi:MAG: hypothetical protein LBS30_03915 [Planctomycetota bacterium]|jgi:hypothetical protein|nr:hypothetical protein [Planctomycetota bacterium]
MPEEPNGGFLSEEAGGAPAPNAPVDAVLAVAEPKAEAASGLPPADDGGYGDFAWPDGYVADARAMEKFVPLARKLGLAREGAQELASLYAELDQERNRAQAQFIAKNNDEWLREIHSHPEFGGRNLEQTGSGVAAMLRRYGSPLLTAQIRQMNIQNWPEMFFFLARVSRAVGEDCSPSGLGVAAPGKSTAQLLFPGLK